MVEKTTEPNKLPEWIRNSTPLKFADYGFVVKCGNILGIDRFQHLLELIQRYGIKNVTEDPQQEILIINMIPICPVHDKEMKLKRGPHGNFFVCSPSCDFLAGISKYGVSSPANQETRDARKRFYDIFDKIWQEGWMGRSLAYRTLEAKFGEEAHARKLDLEQCKRATEIAQQLYDELKSVQKKES